MGIAGVFISGADSAFLYDTLIDLGKENLYKKIWGNVVFYYSIGVSCASIIGGFLGKLDFRYPFFAMIPFMLLLIPLSLSFKEPYRHKEVFSKNYLFDLFKTIKASVFKNKNLRWLIVYSAVIVGFTNVAYYMYQPYFKLSGLDIAYFGLVFAGFNVIAAFSAKYSHFIERKIGQSYSLVILFALVGISLILMGNLIYLFSFLFAFLIQFSKGFSSVVISDYINKLTDSGARATVLSVKSLIEKIFYMAVIPFVGWFADVYSLPQALIFSGAIIFTAGIIIFSLFGRNNIMKIKPEEI